MNDYNNAQIDYRERCKARIQRQLEISKRFLKINCLYVVNFKMSFLSHINYAFIYFFFVF
jgi:hypothetical protein